MPNLRHLGGFCFGYANSDSGNDTKAGELDGSGLRGLVHVVEAQRTTNVLL